MAEIKIPEEAVAEIVHKAILDSIDAETRERIIATAIEWLNKPDSRGYGAPRTTPLQDAFNLAIQQAARTVVNDMIMGDAEVRGFVEGKLRELIRDFTKQLDSKSDWELRNVMISAMVDHLASKKARD